MTMPDKSKMIGPSGRLLDRRPEPAVAAVVDQDREADHDGDTESGTSISAESTRSPGNSERTSRRDDDAEDQVDEDGPERRHV